MGGFSDSIRKYAVFGDRSRRREFWGFVVVCLLISVAIGAITGIALAVGVSGTAVLWFAWIATVLTFLALFVPYLAVSWRRYQDIGVHGAWSIVGWFIPFVTLVVAFIPGTVGPNEFGLDPKGEH